MRPFERVAGRWRQNGLPVRQGLGDVGVVYGPAPDQIAFPDRAQNGAGRFKDRRVTIHRGSQIESYVTVEHRLLEPDKAAALVDLDHAHARSPQMPPQYRIDAIVGGGEPMRAIGDPRRI